MLDPTVPFRVVAVQRALGTNVVRDVDWPLAAAHALAAGEDSRLLRELGGLPRNTPSVDVVELVERVVDELGYQTPQFETAQDVLATIACAWMLDGTWTLEHGFGVIVDDVARWGGSHATAVSARLEERFLGLRYEDDDMPFTAHGERPLQNLNAQEYESWLADLVQRKLAAARAQIDGRDVEEVVRAATD